MKSQIAAFAMITDGHESGSKCPVEAADTNLKTARETSSSRVPRVDPEARRRGQTVNAPEPMMPLAMDMTGAGLATTNFDQRTSGTASPPSSVHSCWWKPGRCGLREGNFPAVGGGLQVQFWAAITKPVVLFEL